MVTKRRGVFAIDPTKMAVDGSFSCPLCENATSPSDESEETYTIAEPKVNRYGIDTLIIRCKKCASHMHLTGVCLLTRLFRACLCSVVGQKVIYIVL